MRTPTAAWTRTIVVLGSILAGAAGAYAGAPFDEAPEGRYDAPVRTIYTEANAPAIPKPEALELTDTISQSLKIIFSNSRQVSAAWHAELFLNLSMLVVRYR